MYSIHNKAFDDDNGDNDDDDEDHDDGDQLL